MRINEEIDNAIQQGLASINNEELLQVYHLWKAIHEKGEHTMLQNIYNFSSAHCYAQAIFLVGKAHRKSVKSWIIMKRKKR